MSPRLLFVSVLLLLAACTATGQPPATRAYELIGTPLLIEGVCPPGQICVLSTWTPTPAPTGTPTPTPTITPTVQPTPAPGSVT